MDCYIYYKAPEASSRQVQVCVQRLFRYLLDHHAVMNNAPLQMPILQRRPESEHGVQTWMEVYRNIPENFAHLAQDAAIASGIIEFLVGDRRLEYFIDADGN
ncbi:DUF4936 family protein [Undibacterium fentianense]|uniref:DUF4936 family protein n=1 Tax=Undibacterium fentianense TaxID=2828728 RepID=A0A941E2P0_9BURK|nr:DUF4936 family protein [Undibacterium fentianense]MBR7798583.1 DUF4936 family protein [Undibacterium fentianense]